MECPYCKSVNVIKGYLMGGYRIRFIPDSEKWNLAKETYPVDVYVCKDCGMVVNLKLKHPEKL